MNDQPEGYPSRPPLQPQDEGTRMGPSEIPRYTLTTHPSGHVDMVPDPKGKWVKFDDAAMEVLMVGADVERHFRSDPYRWERELTLLQAKTGEDD